MRLSSVFILLSTFLIAAVLSLGAAWVAAGAVEESSERAVRTELDRDALTWADVDTNGLQVFLIGTAPTEADRFQGKHRLRQALHQLRVLHADPDLGEVHDGGEGLVDQHQHDRRASNTEPGGAEPLWWVLVPRPIPRLV